MKKTLLSFFACGLILMACGQNPAPPREVQAAFSKQFNTVQELKWEQEDNEWEAEFKSDGTEMSASFDNSGNWLETETEITMKNVPADIIKAVNLKFNGWEMEEFERIEKPDFNGYEIALEKEETETEILVSDSGEIIINKVTVDDEDDEED
jgi:hypothetical protein